MPTAEEMKQTATRKYDQASHTFIDKWPQHLHDLSFKTKLIEVNPVDFMHLYDLPTFEEPAGRIAALLDEHMGWDSYFVRLNSRSPKDATAPGVPITCAGKQAVWWFAGSERILDDTWMFLNAGKPMYVCLREVAYLDTEGEYRCFAKDGKVIAMTRYFYDKEPQYRPPGPQFFKAAENFYAKHLTDYPDIVFDLFAPGSGQAEKLIEINPYGSSDPCLFINYENLEKYGGFLGSKEEARKRCGLWYTPDGLR